MEKMELLAYAKINLTLDVTGRLPNGYHRIDSFMQSVSLADKLTVEIKQGSGIEVGCRSSYAPDASYFSMPFLISSMLPGFPEYFSKF